MHLVHKLDELGRVAWLLTTLALFWWFWPLGVGMVTYLGITGRLSGFRRESRGKWLNMNAAANDAWSRARSPASTGNKAFDDYRADTLHRLEEEQKEFREYLERLRQAKDKAEFDQFMADRRRPPVPAEQSAA